LKVALERSDELKILVKNKNAYPEGGNSYDIKFLGEKTMSNLSIASYQS